MQPDTRQPRRQHEHGAISIMAAVLLVATLLATSLAVDVGRVAFTSRDQQGVTDRAVHDALRRMVTADTDGDGTPDIDEGASLEDLHDLAAASVADTLEGNVEGSSVGTARDRTVDILEIGYMDPSDPSCLHDAPDDSQLRDFEGFCVMYGQDGAGSHYSEYDPTPDAGESVTTVRVATSSTVDYVFGFLGGDGQRDVVKQAFGTNRRTGTGPDCPPPPSPDPCLVDAEAGISVRSRLVELDTGDSVLDDSRLEILQQLLGELIGSSGDVTVTAVGFDGLANATVPLGVLGDAGATVGTTQQLLDSHVTLTDLFTAMASGASASDSAVQVEARSALSTLAGAAAEADPDWDIRIGDLIATTTEDPTALLTAQVNTLDLVVQAALHAELANGDHLAEVDLDSGLLGGDVLGLDGLADLSVDLTVIEAPQMAHGPVRYDTASGRYETIARTAQVQLDATLELNSYYAEDLLGPLENLLSGLLCLTGPALCPDETVAVSLSAARAEAELAGIECMDPDAESDLTTIVTSDAVAASVTGSDEDKPLFTSRDPSTGTIVIPEVPGEANASVSDTTLTNDSELDAMVMPILDLLGIDTGTAYVASHVVDCDVPVLLPTSVGSS